ncbi:DUF485 domain-containing protein [Cytobacillus dafuensis]|uniref:DUF485 domain-containing protein n=1 Tax=Cytobacillus dafuensis TaxID=1742359 RepID=A0A5B8Z108_CYTDA|nr:DUF485 domain-containing protein [Cytobacillus dafuensis]QED46684.1 DUF485 domain-containing protein [Cytobacillus dafuensis]
MAKKVYKSDLKKRGEDFEKIEQSSQFQELMAAKRKFLVPSIILFFGLYLLFPILISYTNLMDAPAIGEISWAWIYALLLFIMTWVMATIYMKKAAAFDHMAEKIWKEDDLDRREAQ